MSENSEESELSGTAPEIKTAQNTKLSLLPERSRATYEKQYDLFVAWCKGKKIQRYTENVLLEYFQEKPKDIKSSTLWAVYSMLKSTLAVKNDIDISKFETLSAFLKRKAVGYKPKKSKSLRRDEINKFLSEAPDKEFLMMKVALIMGVGGACRRDELVKMTIDDIEDNGSFLIVRIPDSKTNVKRSFIVDDGTSFYRRYVALRPPSITTRRLFVSYKNGKCSNQVVGMNNIAKIPFAVAQYLNLPEPNEFTGHCFRTSATLLANYGDAISCNERQTILNFVKQNKDILENKSNDFEAIKATKEKWEELSNILAIKGFRYKKDWQKLREYYNRMKCAAKENILFYKKFGTLPDQSPSEFDWAVHDICPEDFTEPIPGEIEFLQIPAPEIEYLQVKQELPEDFSYDDQNNCDDKNDEQNNCDENDQNNYDENDQNSTDIYEQMEKNENQASPIKKRKKVANSELAKKIRIENETDTENSSNFENSILEQKKRFELELHQQNLEFAKQKHKKDLACAELIEQKLKVELETAKVIKVKLEKESEKLDLELEILRRKLSA